MSDWIFLRGLIREQRHWGSFLHEFESCIPGAKAHPVDLPGNGALNHLRTPHTILEMVDACRRQLQAQGLGPPYRVLAVSMGAMVAVQWAHAYPEEVDSMVLINTSMRPFSAFYRRLRPQNYLPILKLILRGSDAAGWEQAILKMTSHHASEHVLESWRALRERHPVSSRNALRQLWASAVFRSPMHKPLAAILLLASERDQLVAVDCSRAIAARWNVPLRVHPSAGHDLTLDDGPWVAMQVLYWMRPEERAC